MAGLLRDINNGDVNYESLKIANSMQLFSILLGQGSPFIGSISQSVQQKTLSQKLG